MATFSTFHLLRANTIGNNDITVFDEHRQLDCDKCFEAGDLGIVSDSSLRERGKQV
jgi:hypothetical protein